MTANQPPALERYNLFASDRALADALQREGAGWAEERARRVGELLGGEPLGWGHQANAHPPVLRTHDRFGERIDEVEFHPAWHAMMRFSIGHEVHALPWRDRRPGAHVARAALLFLVAQVEAGHCCPLSMTFAATPLLESEPEAGREWVPRLTSPVYDERARPAAEKAGALCGMAMTERQGGSDLRASTTRARQLSGAEYAVTGQKWFCSAPMCDAFVVLAQTERGLSCFLLPRWRPDGARNGLRLQRLKDKLGNRSNASAEVEFDSAWARLLGEEGRGVATIMEMVGHARLECLVASAALMRQAVAQATHHAAHRSAFGRRLQDQPLMQNVLADLALESEAATATALRLARAYDERSRDERERRFARFATPLVKYWICKRTPVLVAEALECLGGNGYVEESILP
ncbi:MAG TPA: acyl-CoA dehydrogenase family protein, partial [Candidatus Methylomirabilis sp.]|nr:acyl-CoA dehydrogenase family protein [Candidatus Methylomirabilis sp.]